MAAMNLEFHLQMYDLLLVIKRIHFCLSSAQYKNVISQAITGIIL
jgi:hypothetical protein